jgi:hypothetical protein
VRSLFARKAAEDSVATQVHFRTSPEAVWNRLIFFEEVPGRPPFILRVLLPHLVRSEGYETGVGAAVQCTYAGGDDAELSYRSRLSRAVRRAATEDAVVVLRSFAEPPPELETNQAENDRSMLWGVVDIRRAHGF